MFLIESDPGESTGPKMDWRLVPTGAVGGGSLSTLRVNRPTPRALDLEDIWRLLDRLILKDCWGKMWWLYSEKENKNGKMSRGKVAGMAITRPGKPLLKTDKHTRRF